MTAVILEQFPSGLLRPANQYDGYQWGSRWRRRSKLAPLMIQ